MEITPLFKELSTQEAIEHGVAGYIYHECADEKFQNSWQTQWYRNSYYQNEANQVAQLLDSNGVEVIFLKGIHLVQDIYPHLATRSMGDIDIYIKDPGQYQKALTLVKQRGYNEVLCKKWKANNFKTNLSKYQDGLEIPLEIHNHLLFDKVYNWKTIKKEHFNYLDLEDNFVYLIGHLAYQHTFLKLSWLHDIYLFLNKYKSELDWSKINCIAKKTKLTRSIVATLYALKCYYGLEVQSREFQYSRIYQIVIRSIITKEFLNRPKKNRLKYFILKHLLKDNFYKSISYNFLWILNRAWKD